MQVENNIVVTILCLVYNHEKYIRQCLEGFVMQKTNFRFEAIVHDDASTDSSASIVLEYANKYPDIIKPIIETENQYSKHDGSIGRIMRSRTHGKYVALCEGDDYWTDPFKLQKQVDFLEAHPDYSLCFHNAIVHYENSDKIDHIFAELKTQEYTRKDILQKWINPTASFVYRRSILESELCMKYVASKKIMAGDLPLCLTASYLGRLYAFKEPMSVYRKHENGMMNSWTNKAYELCLYNIELSKIFGNDILPFIKKKVALLSGQSFRLILNGNIKKGIKLLFTALFFCPSDTICHLLRRVIKGGKYKLC